MWHIFSGILFWYSFWHSLGSLSGIYSDILFGLLSGIYSDILMAFYLAFFLIIYLASILTFFPASLLALYHFIWHSIWHPLAYLLTLFLAFCLVYLRRFFVVEVWRRILLSRACSWGPAEEGGRGGWGRGGPDDIKSNPHLTGGEQYPGCIGEKTTTHQKHVLPLTHTRGYDISNEKTWGDYVRIRFDCFSTKHRGDWTMIRFNENNRGHFGFYG